VRVSSRIPSITRGSRCLTQLKRAGAVSAFLTVLIPKCPLCLVAYTTALGCESIASVGTLRALSAVCLAVAVGSLLLGAVSKRHGYAPFLIAVPSAIALFVGKFNLRIPFVFFSGSVLLVIAIVWSAWQFSEVSPHESCDCLRDEAAEYLPGESLK
jgi:hypothetical protein